ncbi:MAG: hypothetical protein DRI57_27020 [Deltaproteobacteria bacterium]|nr:MAG: hypothetical protein DRI57_27020 [Deltaproteobacteria bacterium]
MKSKKVESEKVESRGEKPSAKKSRVSFRIEFLYIYKKEQIFKNKQKLCQSLHTIALTPNPHKMSLN